MIALKEITEWRVEFKQPNHTYLVEGIKVLAYRKQHKGNPIFLTTKLTLNKRYRKFVEVDISQFGKVNKAHNVKSVVGSKGDVYIVDLNANTCTCLGFTYRGKCKHLP